MKKLLFTSIFPLLIISCSRDDKSCTQTWEYKEYCKMTSKCGWCQPESEATIKTRDFKCSEVEGINPGTEIHLADRDSDCFKFYRKYIRKID